MIMEGYTKLLLTCVEGVLACGMLFALIRSLIGPSRADRIMGINLIGSFCTAALAVLSVFLKENWLLDVCIVYCLISFLSVVLLTKLHIAGRTEKEDTLK